MSFRNKTYRQKTGQLSVLSLLILLVIFQFNALGQSKKTFVITGKISADVPSNENGSIEVAKTSGEVTKIDVPKHGRFKLELEYFNEYTLTFSLPGNLSKTISVSTEIPQDVWEKNNDFPAFPTIVHLEKGIEGIDKSITQKPSGKIFYNKKSDNFEKESMLSDEQIAEQIKNAKKQSGQLKKDQQIIARQESQDLIAKQKSYDKTISEADALFNKAEYMNAMLKYQDAKKLFPDKPYANDRIAEIQDLVKAMENTAQLKAEQEQKYKDAITHANALFEKKSFEEARKGYEASLQIKAGDPYAAGQIKEIDRQIALQEKQKQFDDLVAKADNNYTSKKLDEALALYNQAKALIPENAYPSKQIELINQEKQQIAKANQQEKDYQALIAQADQLFEGREYASAKTGYTKAIALKPGETYPANKIKEIEEIIQKQQLAKQIDDNYKSIIAKADQSFTAKSYAEAREIYTQALTIKPTETYPIGQINKIDNIIAENAKLQQAENEFAAAMTKADNFFNQKDYESAKTSYSAALALKPHSAEVKAKIKNIDGILQKIAEDKNKEKERLTALSKEKEKAYNTAINQANKNVTDKRYSEAKDNYQLALKYMPDAEYPKQQIARLDALLTQATAERQQDELYVSTMKEAEAKLAGKDYAAARLNFMKASEIKPAEQLPVQRVKEIDQAVADIAMAEAKNKTLEANYQQAIQGADAAFTAKEYVAARSMYVDAGVLKPSEKYPKIKLSQIDQLIADAKTQQYKEAIAAADRSFKSNQLDDATSNYELALTHKDNDPYAIKQLAEIAKRRTVLKEEQDRLKKLDEQYTAIIADADNNFNSKAYEIAKAFYRQASAIKPQETLPKEKIDQIDALLNELKNAEEITRLYNGSISTAEEAFNQNKLIDARNAYKAALGYKPTEPIPALWITEIDAMIARQEEDAKLAAQAEAQRIEKEKAEREITAKPVMEEVIKSEDQTSVPAVNIPPMEVATEDRALAFRTINNYDEAIKKADDAFGKKDYTVARFFYYKAIDLKKGEQYPVNQIELIQKLVDSELSAIDRSGYDNIIALADEAFNKKNYPVAKFHYYEALGIKSWEKYPKDRIQEILVLTNSLLSEREEQEYKNYIAKADEALVVKDISIARFYYNKALSMKKEEEYPKIKLKDIQKIIDQDKQNNQNAEYKYIIEQADQAMQAENYSMARFNYNKALSLRPEEKYPKDQLKKIRDLLNKTSK